MAVPQPASSLPARSPQMALYSTSCRAMTWEQHLIRKELVTAGRDERLEKPGLRAVCVTLGSRPASASSAVKQKNGAQGFCGDQRDN